MGQWDGQPEDNRTLIERLRAGCIGGVHGHALLIKELERLQGLVRSSWALELAKQVDLWRDSGGSEYGCQKAVEALEAAYDAIPLAVREKIAKEKL